MIDVFGALLLFVFPGLFLTLILFKESTPLEKIASTFMLSIFLAVITGMILGYNEFMAKLTGGLTRTNLIVWLSALTLILAVIYIAGQRTGRKKETKAKKKNR